MTVVSNSFEGGTDGTTITAANSGGASGTAFDAVLGPPAGGIAAYSNVTPYNGAMALRMAVRGTAGLCATQWTAALGSPVDYFTRFFFKASAVPATANSYILWAEGTANSQIYGITFNTTGALAIRNAAGSPVATSTTLLTPNAWYRVELKTHGDTATGYMTLRLYASTEAPVASFTEELNASGASTWAMSTAATGNLFLSATQGGDTNWPTATDFVYFDQAVSGASDWVGPLTAPRHAGVNFQNPGLLCQADGFEKKNWLWLPRPRLWLPNLQPA